MHEHEREEKTYTNRTFHEQQQKMMMIFFGVCENLLAGFFFSSLCLHRLRAYNAMHGMDWNDFNLATHPTTMHIWMAGNVQRVNIHFLAKAHQEQTKKPFFHLL